MLIRVIFRANGHTHWIDRHGNSQRWDYANGSQFSFDNAEASEVGVETKITSYQHPMKHCQVLSRHISIVREVSTGSKKRS